MAKNLQQKPSRKGAKGTPSGASVLEELDAYRAKRDFSKTAEPAPAPGDELHAKPIFVVQEHHASKLHYDFRLESDGVLKSWAVPKQPAMNPSVKRLAVRVEDHPLAYANFTGDIPEGQYGAGHVEIWDRGTYDPASKSLSLAIEAGKVEFILHGDKLQGGFTLVRAFRGGEGSKGGKANADNWLLIKRKDEFARAEEGTDGAGDAAGAKGTARKPSGRDRGSKPAASGRPRVIRAGKSSKTGKRDEPGQVQFTHVDKVMFPSPGYTKRDVLHYYQQVADKLLPHLRDRPITLERLPDGVRDGAPRFWQKNTPPYYPAWIPRVELPSEAGKPVQYALVNDLRTLLYLVNQGALTFHPFFSRVADLDRPDYVLFDLDPAAAKFAEVVKIAKQLHELLDDEETDPLLKTSGKTGLHVLCPWRRAGGYDEARAWALKVAGRLVEALPDVATTERSKAGRRGRVYVDVMQNARGHHAVPPYVVRAVPEATVSTPLEWKELTPRLDPSAFTIKTAPKRFGKQKADPMGAIVGGE